MLNVLNMYCVLSIIYIVAELHVWQLDMANMGAVHVRIATGYMLTLESTI